MVTLSPLAALGAVLLAGLFFVVQEIRIIFVRKRLDEAVFKAEKRNIQFSYLIKSAQTLSSALSKNRLLRLIIETFGEIAKSRKVPSLCALYLMDYNTNRFIYETGYNMDVTMLSRPSFGPNDDPFKALKKNTEIRFFDERHNLKSAFIKENKMHMLRGLDYAIFIPLIVENDAVGIIVAFLEKSSYEFLKNDLYLLGAVRGQTSIAIGSAVQSELAVLDRLTKIYNHAYFETRLDQEIARANRYKFPVSLLMIDIDHFKNINDTYGHQQGDLLLQQVAQLIKTHIRIVDLCARYGGEEFAVILPETDIMTESGVKGRESGGGDAFARAERIRKLVEEMGSKAPDGSRINVTASIGIAAKRFPDGANVTKDMLIREADKQLYRAKQGGRNKVCYPR